MNILELTKPAFSVEFCPRIRLESASTNNIFLIRIKISFYLYVTPPLMPYKGRLNYTTPYVLEYSYLFSKFMRIADFTYVLICQQIFTGRP